MALVIGLHGYSETGFSQEAYLKITPEADRRGFLYATPDGTKDPESHQFWNATDACCDVYGAGVDDATYLSQVIATVEQRYTVDRVFLIGHSNGAFLGYRMACDHSDQVAAIVALNGAMWTDIARCRPSRPVSVLDIHSTADDAILFSGGQWPEIFPCSIWETRP